MCGPTKGGPFVASMDGDEGRVLLRDVIVLVLAISCLEFVIAPYVVGLVFTMVINLYKSLVVNLTCGFRLQLTFCVVECVGNECKLHLS